MNFLIILALIAVLAMVGLAAATSKESRRAAFQRKQQEQAPIKARSLLTTNEQMTFIKLRKALPDFYVLTRVAMSALLNSSGIVTRHKISRSCVDFVVLDKDFNVISIVEIEPPKQYNSMPKISERDTMLMEAGYRVIRYAHPPDIDRIESDFSKLTHPQKSKKSIYPPASDSSTHFFGDDGFFDHDY